MSPLSPRRGARLLLILAVGACGTERPATPAATLVEAARAIGAGAPLDSSGPIRVFARGTLDKAAEGQGYAPGEPSPGPLIETLAFDPAGEGVRWDYEERRYDGTLERFGESFSSDTLRYLLIHDLGIAVPLRAASHRSDRQSLRRRLPHLLLRELAERPDSQRTIRVSIDPETSELREVEYAAVLPGRGPTRVEWWYDDYREVRPGLRIPFRYGSRVGGLPYTDMGVDSVRFPGDEAFAPPAALERLAVRDGPSADAVDASEVEPLNRIELGHGLFLVPEVRSGFAPLVAEFDEYLVVVDAPASFPLLGRVPAGETDPGPSMSWASERLVDALGRWWPDRPVRYVVLTHHHEDHVGGIRAFVAAGATVLGTAPALAVARRLVDLPSGEVADRLAREPRTLRSELVGGSRELSDGGQSLRLIPVGENPHAEGMLIVAHPETNTLYVSDLLTPASLEAYPRPSHAALDRFFAGWLADSRLAPDSIWTMHGQGPVTPAHLDRARSRSPARDSP